MSPYVWLAAAGFAALGLGLAKGAGITNQNAQGDSNVGPLPPPTIPSSWLPNWKRFDDAFKKYGAMWNVDWMWLKAFACNESLLGTLPSVVMGETSSDGRSWGLMQVTLSTAKDLDANATIEQLANLDPADYSINLAAQYISQVLVPKFGDQLEWIVKAYNEGPTRAAEVIAGEKSDNSIEYWARFQRNINRVKENP